MSLGVPKAGESWKQEHSVLAWLLIVPPTAHEEPCRVEQACFSGLRTGGTAPGRTDPISLAPPGTKDFSQAWTAIAGTLVGNTEIYESSSFQQEPHKTRIHKILTGKKRLQTELHRFSFLYIFSFFLSIKEAKCVSCSLKSLYVHLIYAFHPSCCHLQDGP